MSSLIKEIDADKSLSPKERYELKLKALRGDK
jgi:hypothetical protein